MGGFLGAFSQEYKDGRASLTYEEVSTLVVEIEGLINLRPLTYVFDDDEPNATPLCPSHLIYGRRITSMPNSQHYEVVSTYQLLRKRARHHRNLIQQFTKQWRTEYLLGLREHSRAMARNSKTGNISIGDIILRNDKTSRCFWKLAKVEQLEKITLFEQLLLRYWVVRTTNRNFFEDLLVI